MTRLFPVLLLSWVIPHSAHAEQAPAKPAQKNPPKPALVSSSLNGRDLLFVAHAAGHGRTLSYLASQAAKTNDAGLREIGERLVKSATQQEALLSNLAEMHNLRMPTDDSAVHKEYAARLAKLEGERLKLALLDALIETQKRAIAAYELPDQSAAPAIRSFAIETLPQLRENLAAAQSLAGNNPRPSTQKQESRTEPAR